MRNAILGSALVAGLMLTACKSLEVEDFNASALGDLQGNPTPASINTAATGVLITNRLIEGFPQFSFVAMLGEMGREGYSLDPSNPNITVSRLAAMDNGGGGSFTWQGAYRSIKQAAVLADAVDGVTSFSAAQKAGVKGFAKTMQAFQLLMVVDVMDDAGAVVEFGSEFSGDPKPIVSRDQALAAIVTLLDQAKTDLDAGGATFAFPLSAGFSGFDTPATFLTFNRALKARVQAYQGSYANLASAGTGTASYTAALATLAETFLDIAAPLSLGPAHTFSAGSGDVSNPLYDPGPRIIHAHPSDLADAKLNGAVQDLRATSKVGLLPASKQVNGITVDSKLLAYASPNAPLPIIRNEELILIRAEARMQTGDAAGALADINLVRQSAGGLPAITAGTWNALTPAQQTDSLLYERRYSLLMEGGHRWLDARRFGKLATLPNALPSHHAFSRFVLPDDECVARSPAPAGCSNPPPLN